jgi:hypothetical protein
MPAVLRWQNPALGPRVFTELAVDRLGFRMESENQSFLIAPESPNQKILDGLGREETSYKTESPGLGM